MLFIAAPTIISVVERSFDTSIFYSVNEEESKSGETLKIFETKLLPYNDYDISLMDIEKEKSFNSHLKNYTPSILECLSPPPERC
ncbi:MAG TPA: hypothetical protein PKI08_01675 [Aquaticitalea sp.]|nr:hypothetical protein [Aquaticitalea sp.]